MTPEEVAEIARRAGGIQALSRATDVNAGTLSLYTRGKRPVPDDHAAVLRRVANQGVAETPYLNDEAKLGIGISATPAHKHNRRGRKLERRIEAALRALRVRNRARRWASGVGGPTRWRGTIARCLSRAEPAA